MHPMDHIDLLSESVFIIWVMSRGSHPISLALWLYIRLFILTDMLAMELHNALPSDLDSSWCIPWILSTFFPNAFLIFLVDVKSSLSDFSFAKNVHEVFYSHWDACSGVSKGSVASCLFLVSHKNTFIGSSLMNSFSSRTKFRSLWNNKTLQNKL